MSEVSAEVRRDAHTVMLGAFGGPSIPGWLAGAVDDGLGGVCLYGDNVDAHGSVAPLAREVAALAPGIVLAVDEEGGDVTRLHLGGGSPHPGNAALGAVDEVERTRVIAAGIGAELREAGIWLDLAPCADVNSNPLNPVIGTRSFGSDPALVSRHVAAYVDGLTASGVASSVKHFPGHGDTTTDSHLALPRVSASADVLDRRELAPFRAVLGSAATVMTSHVVLDAIDPDRPATLSRAVLTGLLRERLGYAGVIVSDALDMAGASAELGIGGAAVAALAAGADLLCLGPEVSDEPRTLATAVDAVVAAIDTGDLSATRLADAAERVRSLRERWATASVDPAAAAVEAGRTAAVEVARAVIDRAAVKPLTGRATVVRIDTGTNPAVGATAWGRLDLEADHVDLTARDLDGTAPFGGEVLVVARRATSHPQVWGWIAEQLRVNPQARLVELAWPDPQLVDRPDTICTLGSAAVLLDALASALRGDGG